MSDDHSNLRSSATPLSLGTSRAGSIETASDRDAFKVDLVAGRRYEFQALMAGDNALGLAKLSLFDSATGDNSFRSVISSYLAASSFIAPVTGSYFIEIASGNQTATGGYSLTVNHVTTQDDHSDYLFEATAMSVGVARSGVLDISSDTDYFALNLVSGRRYQFEMTTPGPTGLNGSGLFLVNTDFQTVDYSYDSERAVFFHVPKNSGTFYLATYAGFFQTGTYGLKVTEIAGADDHADQLIDATILTVNSARAGTIDVAGEKDCFKISLNGGERYVIEMAATGAGSLDQAYLKLFSNPESVAWTESQISADLARIIFTPTASGVYYLVASESGDNGTGTYSIQVNTAPVDDHSDSPQGASVLSQGVTLTGNIEESFDQDYFRVDLTAGRRYLFELSPTATNSLPKGTLDLFADEADRAFGIKSGSFYSEEGAARFSFIAENTGAHYLKVQPGFEKLGGSYTIRASELPTFDDHSDFRSSASAMSVGSTRTGNFEFIDDIDAFSLQVVQGRRYLVDMNITGPSALTSGSLELTAQDGRHIKSAAGLNRIVLSFTADTTGTVSLQTSTGYFFEDTGSYTLSAAELNVADDFADDPDGAISLFAGQNINGRIDFESDEDLFKVDLIQGRSYKIDLNTAGPGSLPSGGLGVIYSEFDLAVYPKFDSDSDLASVSFVAERTGTYKIYVYAAYDAVAGPYATGNYTLSFIDTTNGTGNGGDGGNGGSTSGDVITGTDLANNLTGSASNDIMDGRGGNDTLTGLAGNDSMLGGGGNDSLNGGAGTDTMYGGAGNDTYVVEQQQDVTSEAISASDARDAGGIDTVQSSVSRTLGAFIENLKLTGASAINGTGNGLNNSLTGNQAANVLTGNAGNDTLNGGGGADTLYGGAGNDVYVVDLASVVISEAIGANNSSDAGGIDTVQTSVTRILGTGFENLTLTGTSAINGTGNAKNNVLTGNGSANLLSGLTGVDTLNGAGGNDTLNGGEGADIMYGGSGNDIYVVDNLSDLTSEARSASDPADAGGIDTVQSSVTRTLGSYLENLVLTGSGTTNGAGNALANTLTGNSASNALNGNAGNDLLFGNGGSDTLNGGTGSDSMYGGAGNDTYVVDALGDLVSEARSTIDTADAGGVDIVQSSVTHTLRPFFENLTLTGVGEINGTGNAAGNLIHGNAVANVLSGMGGNDLLFGNAGNDRLDGGAGSDSMYGGAGNDVYIVDNASDFVSEAVGTNNTRDSGGFDTVITSVSRTLGAGVESLILSGTAAINGNGNSLDNQMIGNASGNAMSGFAGNDYIEGRGGNDTLNGGEGNDVLIGEGFDEATGDSVIVSNNRLSGGAGNDLLFGGEGNDVLDPGTGRDFIFTGSGNDTVIGGDGNVFVLVSGSGNRLIDGGVNGIDSLSYSLDDGIYSDELGLIIDTGSGSITNADTTAAIQINDTVTNFEYISGSNKNDYFILGGNVKLLGDGQGHRDTYYVGSLQQPDLLSSVRISALNPSSTGAGGGSDNPANDAGGGTTSTQSRDTAAELIVINATLVPLLDPSNLRIVEIANVTLSDAGVAGLVLSGPVQREVDIDGEFYQDILQTLMYAADLTDESGYVELVGISTTETAFDVPVSEVLQLLII